METEKLQEFFKNEDFNVHLFEQDNEQCAQIETWTDGGVNMFIYLIPFTVEEFLEYIDEFDIDEEIDVHREDQRYKNAFSIRESLDDFTEYHNRLKRVAEKLKKL